MPGADDVMLNYQSLSHHDAMALRSTFGLRPAPEFETWLANVGLSDASGRMIEPRSSAGAGRLLSFAAFS